MSNPIKKIVLVNLDKIKIQRDTNGPYRRIINIPGSDMLSMYDCITLDVKREPSEDVTRIESVTKKFNVITLCGSTRYKEEFLAVQKKLTLEGNIVISVGLFGHSGDNEVWSDNKKAMLDEMHLEKIYMSDEIFVINPGNYIGESTKREIEYAEKLGKKITYLETPEEPSFF